MIFVSFSFFREGMLLFGNDLVQEASIETMDDICRIQHHIEELYNVQTVVILNWKIL